MKISVGNCTYCMEKSFAKYVEDCRRAVEYQRLRWLVEVSEQFPKSEINSLFDDQLRELIRSAEPDQREEQRQMLNFDYVGYIAKSLRNAGFRNEEIDALVQEVVVKLIVSPGRLFRGWQGQPVDRRFKASVRNAILNLVEKQRTRRKNLPSVPISTELQPAAAQTWRDEGAIERFRELVQERLGELAVEILQARLDGGEIKSLVNDPDLGSPSRYRIKQAVQQIKQLAREFAASEDDPHLRWLLERLFEQEADTLAKRFAKVEENTEVVSPFEKVTMALSAVPEGLKVDALQKATGLSSPQFVAAVKWLQRTGKLDSTWIKGERGLRLAG